MVIPAGLALVFDLDGVIVDSMPLHTEAWRAYLDGLGIVIPDLEARMHGGRNDHIVREFIGPPLSPEAVFEHGAAKERLFREMLAPRLEQYAVGGVLEFLASCNGVPKGVASNAEPANIDFTLDGLGIRRFFQAIVDGHQVKRPKPFPDIYLRVAELLGVAPADCIVFEDSPTGVEAARAAGARVVGIGTHAVSLDGVSIMARDFSDPTLAHWLSAQRPTPADA